MPSLPARKNAAGRSARLELAGLATWTHSRSRTTCWTQASNCLATKQWRQRSQRRHTLACSRPATLRGRKQAWALASANSKAATNISDVLAWPTAWTLKKWTCLRPRFKYNNVQKIALDYNEFFFEKVAVQTVEVGAAAIAKDCWGHLGKFRILVRILKCIAQCNNVAKDRCRVQVAFWHSLA